MWIVGVLVAELALHVFLDIDFKLGTFIAVIVGGVIGIVIKEQFWS